MATDCTILQGHIDCSCCSRWAYFQPTYHGPNGRSLPGAYEANRTKPFPNCYLYNQKMSVDSDDQTSYSAQYVCICLWYGAVCSVM